MGAYGVDVIGGRRHLDVILKIEETSGEAEEGDDDVPEGDADWGGRVERVDARYSEELGVWYQFYRIRLSHNVYHELVQ